MTTSKKNYHHGDLRESLLSAATDLISEGGVDNLSIRKLADKVGVSRTAPYHHFKDKNELLCAIAEQGFKQQDELIKSIPTDDQSLSAIESFERYVLTYLRFADEQRETYDLMYGREIWKTGQPTTALQEISKSSFHLWLEWVEALQQQHVFDPRQPSLRIAQSSWAALHGLCRLFNDGIYVNREDIADIAKNTVRMLTNHP
ncbi:MAG: TetR family transcriptional regulator [Oceanospirillaceae bacterium]|nr:MULTISPECIES: TetR/AcrR family transcriptional regulator [unclassified Neptuniibacter]MAY42232.1 TetR family transcriptional regulator [Oceanospirillaceae bacterium]|tara:strand:+ start:3321 stop:3926 length:606 start_codon:yes stop_codon:yes gene_type:complete